MDIYNCYTIVDCDPQEGEASLQQIDLMAQGVINEMHNRLNEIATHVSTKFQGYPSCEVKTCHWVNARNECEERSELLVTYFAPCDQLLLDQIQRWNFLPIIPTRCEIDPNLSIPDINDINCTGEAGYSKRYQVSQTSVSGN